MFKPGDKVVRAFADQSYTLDDVAVGDEVTVHYLDPTDKDFFGVGQDYDSYFLVSDFKLVEDKSVNPDDIQASAFDKETQVVKVLQAQLNAVYALPRDKAFVVRVEAILTDFKALAEALEKEIPALEEALEQTKEDLRGGEYTIEQLQKLIAIAKIGEIEGDFHHAHGALEDLRLNWRGALRPPVNVWQAGDTVNIDHIEVELKSAPGVIFNSEQTLALLKSL